MNTYIAKGYKKFSFIPIKYRYLFTFVFITPKHSWFTLNREYIAVYIGSSEQNLFVFRFTIFSYSFEFVIYGA